MDNEEERAEDIDLTADEMAASDAAFDSMKGIDWTDENRVSEMEQSIDFRHRMGSAGTRKPVSDSVTRTARDAGRIDAFLRRNRPEAE